MRFTKISNITRVKKCAEKTIQEHVLPRFRQQGGERHATQTSLPDPNDVVQDVQGEPLTGQELHEGRPVQHRVDGGVRLHQGHEQAQDTGDQREEKGIVIPHVVHDLVLRMPPQTHGVEHEDGAHDERSGDDSVAHKEISS